MRIEFRRPLVVALALCGPLALGAQTPPAGPPAAAAKQTTTIPGGIEVEKDTARMKGKVPVGQLGMLLTDEQWKKTKAGLPKLEVGTWVEYETTHPELNLGTMKLSIVPQRDLPGPSWRVLEILSVAPTGDRNYVKLSFPRPTTDMRNARGLILKPSAGPPFIIPLNQDESSTDNFSVSLTRSSTAPAEVVYLGEAEVTVPAGTFRTWRYRIRGENTEGKPTTTEVWLDISGKVPILRAVQIKDGETYAKLSAFGRGAKSDLPYMPVPR